MQIHIQTRDFTLTPALAAAVYRGVDELEALLAERPTRIDVRLYDTNGTKGGVDKACLITLRTCRARRSWVVSYIDADLYRAIGTAFDMLRRMMTSAGGRDRNLRRRQRNAALARVNAALGNAPEHQYG